MPQVSYLKVVVVTCSPKFSIIMNFSRLRSNCLALFHPLCKKFSTYLRLIIFFPVLEPSNSFFLKILPQLPFPTLSFFCKEEERVIHSQSFDDQSCLYLSLDAALRLRTQLSNAEVSKLFLSRSIILFLFWLMKLEGTSEDRSRAFRLVRTYLYFTDIFTTVYLYLIH